MNTVKIQTPKMATWENAAGDQVPFKFVPKSDKTKESLAGKIHKAALAAESTLSGLYAMMDQAFQDVKEMINKEYEINHGKSKKQGKGSLTWFNFDKSIKVEADINEIVKWDNALMTEAHNLLRQYISTKLADDVELITGLVAGAFANSKGMIDTAKVFQILKYEDKIKNLKFQKACELMKKAQSIDRTKLYMRVWEKQADGQYRNINLNFSSL